MFLGHDWDWWVPIFTIVAAVFSIAAGTLAIFQDHHTKDGTLTRFGWTLAALIIASGAASLGLGVLDRIIGDQKEHAESVERGGQFQSQMGELRGLAASLERVQTDMQGSLAEQRRLSGVADRNLSTSEALQRQEQANTLSVLRRVFSEGNRISAERIAIAVTYRCPPGGLFIDVPTIRRATLTVRSGSSPEVSLTTPQITQLGDGIIFHGFIGDLRRFETFPAWRNAQISIRLDGGDDRLGVALVDLVDLTAEEQRRAHNRAAVSCPATTNLLLNGRQVLSATANFTRRGASSIAGYAADFENLRVDVRRLPHF